MSTSDTDQQDASNLGFDSICPLQRLQPERGVAALLHGRQIAVFRTHDNVLHALDNRDPFTGQNVLSRGIVGTHGDIPTVASPLLKQTFDLRTGICISDPIKHVAVHDVQVRDGMIEVRMHTPAEP